MYTPPSKTKHSVCWQKLPAVYVYQIWLMGKKQNVSYYSQNRTTKFYHRFLLEYPLLCLVSKSCYEDVDLDKDWQVEGKKERAVSTTEKNTCLLFSLIHFYNVFITYISHKNNKNSPKQDLLLSIKQIEIIETYLNYMQL